MLIYGSRVSLPVFHHIRRSWLNLVLKPHPRGITQSTNNAFLVSPVMKYTTHTLAVIISYISFLFFLLFPFLAMNRDLVGLNHMLMTVLITRSFMDALQVHIHSPTRLPSPLPNHPPASTRHERAHVQVRKVATELLKILLKAPKYGCVFTICPTTHHCGAAVLTNHL